MPCLDMDGSIRFRGVGNREETSFRLNEKLLLAQMYYTHNYKVYEYLPSGHHKIGKFGRVNRDSVLRDRLKRLVRRTGQRAIARAI